MTKLIANEDNDDAWQKFDDLIGGDNNFFDAREWFKRNAESEGVILVYEQSEHSALNQAMAIYNDRCGAANG